MYWHKTPAYIQWLYPQLTWHKSRKEKKIYVTFDDGPIPEVTPNVLNILDQFGAKATFFCVGDNVNKHGEIYDEVLHRGHKTGNHTYNHLNGWKHEVKEYLDNVNLCAEVASEATFFRPAYGKMKRAAIKPIQQKYEIIMWDVLAGDFDRSLSQKDCLKNTINATRRGSIIIFHDSLKAEDNMLYALPRFLEHFKNKGYKLAAL